jgi:hypothetical protein
VIATLPVASLNGGYHGQRDKSGRGRATQTRMSAGRSQADCMAFPAATKFLIWKSKLLFARFVPQILTYQ